MDTFITAMAATIFSDVTPALKFAIADEEAGLVTQSVSVTFKVDKKEARDKQGGVVAVAYYNKTAEVTIEGIGKPTSGSVGVFLALAGAGAGKIFNPFVVSSNGFFVEELTIDTNNEEFVATTIKGMAYEGITDIA